MASGGTFKRDDLVLARMRGYAPWPAMIVTPEQVPADVLASYFKPKRPKERIVRFLPDADYAFYDDEQLVRFSSAAADKTLKSSNAKLNGSLRKAYNVARADPIGWARDNDEVVAAARGSKRPKAKAAAAPAGVTHGRGEAKRKPAAVAANPPAKRRRRGLPTPSDEDENDGVESEADEDFAGADLTVAPAEPSTGSASELSLSSPPDAHRVKLWRFELQRIFLADEIVFDELDTAAEHFALLEAYAGITADQIHYSKVNKVLKKIIALKSRLPASVEAKYRFTARANKLLQQWKPILSAVN